MTSQFQVLNKILQTKDYSFITLNNLTKEYFFSYPAEYEFIRTHYDTYHTVPDRLTFLNSFPEFVIQDVNEPDNYLVEQLYNDYNQSYLASRFNGIKKLLEVYLEAHLFIKSHHDHWHGGVMQSESCHASDKLIYSI